MFVASERLSVAVNTVRLLDSHAMLLAQLQMHFELETLTTASQSSEATCVAPCCTTQIYTSTLRDTSFASS